MWVCKTGCGTDMASSGRVETGRATPSKDGQIVPVLPSVSVSRQPEYSRMTPMAEEIPGIIPGVPRSLSERKPSPGGRSHKLFSLIKMIQNGWVSRSLYPALKLCLC